MILKEVFNFAQTNWAAFIFWSFCFAWQICLPFDLTVFGSCFWWSKLISISASNWFQIFKVNPLWPVISSNNMIWYQLKQKPNSPYLQSISSVMFQGGWAHKSSLLRHFCHSDQHYCESTTMNWDCDQSFSNYGCERTCTVLPALLITKTSVYYLSVLFLSFRCSQC